MENEEYKITNTSICRKCKKELDIEHFIGDNEIYQVCNICINYINNNKLKNFCKVCGIRGNFNYHDFDYGAFCSIHKKDNMIDIIHNKCEYEGCNIQPSFNFIDEIIPKYCSAHAKINMVDIISKKCEENNCNKIASFNIKGETIRKYCKNHAKIGMIDISHSICQTDGCNIRASFNFKNETNGIFCKNHSLKDMICVTSKKCIETDCLTQPSFNYESEICPIYCKKHMKSGMVNVKDNKCAEDGCNIRPHYNFKNETVGKYCKKHSLKDMICVTAKKCEEEGCLRTNPVFNFKGNTVGRYCNIHKKDNMFDVIHKICEYEECNIKPSFNFKGEKSAKYCKKHAKKDMVDVINKSCIINDCNTRPNYGYCGQSPIYCAKHRNLHNDKNFLYIKPKRKCIGNDDEDCKDIAEYGKTEPNHCLDHKTEDEIHLVAQKCIQCYNNDLLDKDGLCITYCHPNQLYQQVKQEKKKENTVLNYLNKYVKLSNIIDIKDDRIINTLCNNYRPDRIYDIGTHCIIIEVDEDQHKGTRSSCSKGEIGELARMHEIQNAIGMNCIFLRFNPDNFKVNGKNKKINMNERLKLLVKWIEQCETMKPEKDLEPVKYKYLFYDSWDETDISFKEIDDTDLYDK